MIHKLVNSISNKEELPDGWKKSIIIQIYNKDGKADCNYYHAISPLSSSCEILSNILLLGPYIVEVIGDQPYGLRRNRPTTDKISALVR
jgi:hypothetical protein